MAADRRRLLEDHDDSDDNSTVWTFDQAVEKVGFGRYQFILWFFLSLVAMSCGFNNMVLVFEGGDGGHLCVTPANITSADNSSFTYYFPDKCFYNKTQHVNGSKTDEHKIKCDRWLYNTTVFNTTIGMEWSLVCDKEYLINLSATIYMLGFFTGCLILGDLSDRYGRRLMLMLSFVLTLGMSFAVTFAPNYEVFSAARFFVGMGTAGTRNAGYIMSAEFARPKDRGTLGLISDMTYSCAYLLTGLIFYLNPNWRQFQLYITLFHIFFLTYVLFLPESPRWLLTTGKLDQTLKYFRKSARINGKPMPPEVKIAGIHDHTAAKKHSVLDLGRTPNLRKVGFILIFLWFIVSLVYFGMSYNVGNLEGSIFVNNAILGGVELFANTVAIWIVKLGRRPAIVSSFAIAALSMLAMCFAQKSYWGIIILAMIGKFVITPCFSYIYIATTELYPTQTRTLALGTGSALARLGGAVAPFVPYTYSVWDVLPYIIFTVASVIGTLFALFIPETMDRELPDSIERAEMMNKIRCSTVCTVCSKSETLPVSTNTEEEESSHLKSSLSS